MRAAREEPLLQLPKPRRPVQPPLRVGRHVRQDQAFQPGQAPFLDRGRGGDEAPDLVLAHAQLGQGHQALEGQGVGGHGLLVGGYGVPLQAQAAVDLGAGELEGQAPAQLHGRDVGKDPERLVEVVQAELAPCFLELEEGGGRRGGGGEVGGAGAGRVLLPPPDGANLRCASAWW